MDGFDPNQPINPNDLTYWEIDVKFLLEELEDRLTDLKSQSCENFENDFSRGEHTGMIAELISTIERIKRNMIPAPHPTRP